MMNLLLMLFQKEVGTGHAAIALLLMRVKPTGALLVMGEGIRILLSMTK